MFRLRHLFIPHEQNRYRPYLVRYQALSIIVIVVLLAQFAINFFYFGTPQVLGFATSIYAEEIIALTNSQRQQNGVGTVSENSLLNEAALLKAQNMFEDNYWAHTNPYDSEKDPWYWFEQAGYDYYMAGENLAMNFDTSAGVINGWMASSSHRENLLNGQFTEIGVAVLNGELLGEETTLVVQFFGRPFDAPVGSSGSSQGSNTPPAPTPVPTVIAGNTRPTPTPTTIPPTPTPTPTPKPGTVTAIVKTPSGNTPIQTNASFFSGEQKWDAVKANLLNPASISIGRAIMLATLVFLTVIFMFDSLVIVHRQHFHVPRSHGFMHAGIFSILIVALMYSSVGAVL